MPTGRTTRIAADVALGLLGGAIVAAGIGLSQLVATGLTLGLRIGMDGNVQAVGSPEAPWAVGLFVLAFSGLLYASRRSWWTPVAGRVSALAVVVGATVVGVILFDGSYIDSFGTVPWYRAIPIEVARSVSTYAFVGVSAVSLLARPRRGTSDERAVTGHQDEPTPSSANG